MHADAKVVVAEAELDIDPLGACVTKRVADGLASDAAHFVADDRMQRLRPALNNEVKCARVRTSQLLRRSRQRAGQIVRAEQAESQLCHAGAASLHHFLK